MAVLILFEISPEDDLYFYATTKIILINYHYFLIFFYPDGKKKYIFINTGIRIFLQNSSVFYIIWVIFQSAEKIEGINSQQ